LDLELMEENKKPKIDYSKLTPEQRAQLDAYERESKQLSSLEDIAAMTRNMAGYFDEQRQSTGQKTLIIDHVTSEDFVRLLEQMHEALEEYKEKDEVEMPDYASPVVEAIKKLENQLSSLNKELPTPQVNVEAPSVTVEPARVDLSGIEKTIRTIPDAFSKAIKQIPKVDIPEFPDRWDDVLRKLESIDIGTRIKPQFPNTIRVTNPDGSLVGAGGGGGGSVTQYQEDTVAPDGNTGVALLGVRRDADTSPVDADGDWHNLTFNAVGRAKVSVWPGAYAPTTGTITSATSVVGPVDISRAGAVTVMVSGTYAAVNFTFEVSIDGTTWIAIPAQPISLTNAQVTASGALTNATAGWDISPLLGLTFFRVRATAWTSGTANISINPAATAIEPAVQANQGGTWTVQPGNTANTTAWLMRISPAPTPTITQVTPSATSVTIKAALATRRSLILFNGGTSICYVTYGATSSTTAFTFPLQANERVTIRGEEYSGVVSGIWAATGGTSMQVTETV
jgi:hypothetical protein